MRNNYTGLPVRPEELSHDENYRPNVYNIYIKGDFTDINPVSAGESHKAGAYRTQIATADCTNLYYVFDGSGTVYINDESFKVKGGDFFVVPLGARAGLKPTQGTTLPHRWVGFTGLLTHDFERFPRPFTLPEEIVRNLCDPRQSDRNLGSRLAADLFLIHSLMQEPKENKPDYVQRLINHINTSYMEKLSVTQMAQELGLDRCHLSRLFKQKMNMSIQDYILQFRLNKARRYLKHNYSVSDTAHLCGFGDRANFSKIFTREVGCSPTKWCQLLDRENWNKPR